MHLLANLLILLSVALADENDNTAAGSSYREVSIPLSVNPLVKSTATPAPSGTVVPTNPATPSTPSPTSMVTSTSTFPASRISSAGNLTRYTITRIETFLNFTTTTEYTIPKWRHIITDLGGLAATTPKWAWTNGSNESAHSAVLRNGSTVTVTVTVGQFTETVYAKPSIGDDGSNSSALQSEQ